MSPAKASRFKLPSYTQGVLFVTLAFFVFFTYAGPLGYALTATFGGLLLLGYGRHVRDLGWTGVALLALLGWLILRSSLLHDIQSGADFSQYQTWEDQAWLKMLLQPVWYAALILAALHLPAERAARLTGGLLYAFVGLCLLIIADAVSGARIYQALAAALYKPIRPDLAIVKLSIATYAIVLLYWAILLVGHQRGGKVQVAALGACLLAPVLTGANAPVLAMLVSIAVFWIVKRVPRLFSFSVYHWIAVIVAFKILYFPIFIHFIRIMGWGDNLRQFLPASWDARLGIWEFAAEKILQKPFLGWGFDASRHFGDAIPLHPHNMSIQVALELGYIGLILLSALWVLLILRIGQGATAAEDSLQTADALTDLHEASTPRATDTRPYVMATLAGFFTLAQLSFGVWQEWWLALAAIVTVVLILAQRAIRQGEVSN